MEEPIISVIVVSFNTKKVLRKCLHSLRKETVPLEVFVVDNVSTDGTRTMLENEFADWPALRLIYNDNNVGFAKASNQPLPSCVGKYILFLNPDTIVQPGALMELASFLDKNPKVGVVGPKLVYSDGSLQVSCGSTWGGLRAVVWHLFPFRVSRYIFRKECIRRTRYEWCEVGWILGACLMIRKELALVLRGFDENFFLSADDSADLCLRAKKRGYRVAFYPRPTIVHLGGESYKTTRAFALVNVYRGHLYFVKKHRGIFWATLLRIMLCMSSLIKATGALILGITNKRYRLLFRTHIVGAYKAITMPLPRVESYDGVDVS